MSARTIAIVGGRVVPVIGAPLDGGTLLLRGGVIAEVGTDVMVPDDAVIVDAADMWVLPGFIEPHSHVGVHEEDNGWAGADGSEVTTPNTAGVRAVDAINIEDEGFRDALSGGITTAVVKPGSGNPIGGLTLAMKTWGGRTVDEQVISDSISVKSAVGENPKRTYGDRNAMPSTRLGIAYVIRQAFVDAQHYAATRDAAAATGDPFARDLAKEALARVLTGELAWDQHAHRHDDIATAMRMADEFGYRLVINHGTEAHKVADVLAERGIPVIFGPLISSRSKVEVREAAISHLPTLVAAGVLVCMTTDHPVVPINHLVLQASLAVSEGLSPKVAIEMLTINAARICGIQNRTGALVAGLDADVVMWSGDPLATTSHAERVFIDGVEVYRRQDGKRLVRERGDRSVPDRTVGWLGVAGR